jgi:hypothetical protein
MAQHQEIMGKCSFRPNNTPDERKFVWDIIESLPGY